MFFSIFYVALCQKVSFLLRLSFQTASPVFDRFSSFSWQSGQNRMFLVLRRPFPWLLLLSLSYGIVGFASPIAVLADSFVRFARSGAVLADSLVRIAFRRLWERPPGTSKTVPGFPRPEIVFAELFYKGFYKAFCTLPFSRNLVSPAQVSQMASDRSFS